MVDNSSSPGLADRETLGTTTTEATTTSQWTTGDQSQVAAAGPVSSMSPTIDTKEGMFWSAGGPVVASSLRNRQKGSVGTMAWWLWAWTPGPRRTTSLDWWLRTGRDISGQEARWTWGMAASDGPQAGDTMMSTGPTLEGKTILWCHGLLSLTVLSVCRADRPQPDNREGDEECLAVLNNFYADGIRFHDVSCHHKKPVICEAK